VALAYKSFRGVQPAPMPAHLERVAEVPDFRFVDQAGQPVTLADLKGKIWVANFIFTRCAGPCPVMTSRMAELKGKLGRVGDGVVLVSVSVDPDFDTPEVLKAYADRLGADPTRWKFLSGPKPEIDEFVVKGMLQPLAKDVTGLPAHSTRFVLVDREGWLRGFQDGNDPEVVQKLLMDIGDLLRENPQK
jgi:protein SCO1/2